MYMSHTIEGTAGTRLNSSLHGTSMIKTGSQHQVKAIQKQIEDFRAFSAGWGSVKSKTTYLGHRHVNSSHSNTMWIQLYDQIKMKIICLLLGRWGGTTTSD